MWKCFYLFLFLFMLTNPIIFCSAGQKPKSVLNNNNLKIPILFSWVLVLKTNYSITQLLISYLFICWRNMWKGYLYGLYIDAWIYRENANKNKVIIINNTSTQWLFRREKYYCYFNPNKIFKYIIDFFLLYLFRPNNNFFFLRNTI